MQQMTYLKIVLFSVTMCFPLVKCQLSRASQISQLQKEQRQSLISKGISDQRANQDLSVTVWDKGKREVRSKRESETNCTVVESSRELGLHMIKEVKLSQYKFFIKPEPEFRKLVFHMKIDNLWNVDDPYVTYENLDLNNWELENVSHSPWKEIEVKYYRHVRSGRDKHGLQVSVGKLSKAMSSSPWWRTHNYEGFVVFIEGPATIQFDCFPPEYAMSSLSMQAMRNPVVLGSLLGSVFLVLVVLAGVLIIMTRRKHNQHPDYPPPVPPLPKSRVS
nr:uncharacterized protein LOC128685768 [Cherax quadricarinatus]